MTNFTKGGMMKHFILLLILSSAILLSQNEYEVYINEIRANDDGADDREFIELIGPAGTDISGFQIIHYNGTESLDGGLWSHTIGTFTLPDDGITDASGKALGFYVLGCGNNSIDACDEVVPGVLQNGEDGLILYDASSNILDAVAWQGAGDMATDDPGTVTTSPPASADNYLHITMDDDAGDRSLQAPNNVFNDDGSGWIVDSATVGSINRSQGDHDIQLPVQLTFFTASAGDNQVTLRWRTESEINNRGFIIKRSQEKEGAYSEIASYKNCDALKGAQNSSQRIDYAYTDYYVFNNNQYWYKLFDVDHNGIQTEQAVISATPEISDREKSLSSDANVPVKYRLMQNVPNPFNPATVIQFDIPEDTFISLTVYDILGRKIKSLITERLPAGSYFIHWDGTNEEGYKVPSGVYFCILSSNQYFSSKKMILAR
jgi:hypothetical protein